MANSLYPAFVVAEYLTPYSAHKHTIPTKDWFPANVTHPLGYYLAWDDSEVDAETMIEDYLDLFMDTYINTASFFRYTIYTMDAFDAQPIAVAMKNVSIVGGQSAYDAGERDKATQRTFTFRTISGGIAKITKLDDICAGEDNRILVPTPGGADEGIIGNFTSDTLAWSGRNGQQPLLFLQIAEGDNDRLRKAYRMV